MHPSKDVITFCQHLDDFGLNLGDGQFTCILLGLVLQNMRHSLTSYEGHESVVALCPYDQGQSAA
jgi:hypothetical protein